MRRWRIAGIAGGVLLLLAILATTFVPPWVAERDMARLSRRLGARIHAADVSGAPGSITVRRLEIAPRGLSSPLVKVERIDVHYSLLALLWGDASPTRIEVVHPVVHADLRSPDAVAALARLVTRARGRGPAEPASRAPYEGPELSVTRGVFALVDRRGVALSVADVEAALSETGEASVTLSGVEAGAVPDDAWLSLHKVEAGLSLAAHALTRAAVEGGRVRVRRYADGSVEAAEVVARMRALEAEVLGAAEERQPTRSSRLPRVSFAALTIDVDDQTSGRHSALGPIQGSLEPEPGMAAASLSVDATLGEGGVRLEGTIDAREATADLQAEIHGASLEPVVALVTAPEWIGFGDAVATGSLHVVFDRGDDVGLEGQVEVSGVDVRSPEIAAAPLEDVAIGFRGRVRIREGAKAWTVPDAHVSLNGVDVAVRGGAHLDGGSADRATLDVSLPPTPCDALLRRLPRPLVSQLAAFRLQGSLAFAVHVRFDRADLDATELDFDVDNHCSIAVAAGVDRLRGVFTRTVPDGEGGSREFITGPGSETWTPLSSISPYLVGAVLTTEDGGFFHHGGFAPRQIREAFIRDLRSGRFSAGGSTISMQLAKNVFLSREKTLARKLQEAFFTWLLEQSMSKDEILELYLNVIEYGPGIYGVRNAADHFFGLAPGELSPVQAIYLATVLPDPTGRYAQFERGRPWDSTMSRIDRIAHTMAARGRLDGMSAEDAIAEPIVFRGDGAVADADVADDEGSGTY